MGVCTKEREGVTAAVLMATPCTNSLCLACHECKYNDDDDVINLKKGRTGPPIVRIRNRS